MGHVSDIPRRGAARTAKLATLPLGMAGRAAAGLGKRLAGQSSDEITAELSAKAAEQLFAVLGELKGGAMKLGQAMSVFEAAMPDELAEPYREALTKLQNEAPPMPAKTVHRVLDHQLGTRWRERFRSFDDAPSASASIGQVHHGVWSDGRDVAVKVQYPGADEALLSDLRQLRRLAPLFKPFAPGTDIKGLMDELTDRSVEELDYRIEADNQRAFATEFAGDPHIAVPAVIASSPKVVVSEWMTGTPLAQVIAGGSRDERNAAGERLCEFHFAAPARVGLMHTDPHPGNFMMLGDGRLGVIDFGAAVKMSAGIPPELTTMVRLAVHDRRDELVNLMTLAGYVTRRERLDAADAMEFLRPFVEPLHTDRFHFTRAWMQEIAGRYSDVRGREFATSRSFTLPPQYLMVHRVLLGSVAILCQLDAQAPYREVIRRWAPEMLIDPDSGASHGDAPDPEPLAE
ncbi:AarF/ABC1/UbiB kinase family protein [Rhodococcus sp. D2-41]|uniref:ABC1 kinase family protein n=1 Tax=Speluncibacter jeojiensis TaxID=2710754 RepID=UPI00240F4B96|nr:AarF/UbiB family protein [Rhodococcus sp. D2-41]MDG3008720.1 AarF/ABC1/UbiB kinase family protein [Rhodococcus sp. D2-41]